MPKRFTIYIADPVKAALGPVDDADSLSGRIGSIIIRYDQIRLEACPELLEAEWCAICDANNGTWLQAEHGQNDPARYAWMNVADSDELDEKWGVDRLELARRMKEMTLTEQCAVIEVIGRFWRPGTVAEGSSYKDILLGAGAKIKK